MRFYVSSRVKSMDKVRAAFKLIKERGHEITEDWTAHPEMKPFNENLDLAAKCSVRDVDGVRNSDVYILLTEEGGTGMYVELGFAIAFNLEKGKPDIYVIGEHTSKTMFSYHPAVRRKNTIEDVLEEIDFSENI